MNTQSRIKKVLTLAVVAMAIIGLPTASASADLVDGLVEYWGLDGDYSAEVTSTHEGTLTTTGTGSGTFVTGKFSQGIDLENSSGNQAYVVVGGDENDFDFAGQSMSVSLWYTTESLYTSWQCLAAKGEGSSWRLHRNSNSDYGSTEVDINFHTSINVTGDGELDQQDGSWHHVVATADAVNGGKLYVDGNLVDSVSGTIAIAGNAAAMQIGGNPGAGGRGWDGILDDVGVWNRALTADEVSLIWNGGAGVSIGNIAGISPYDGETVSAGYVDLSWKNLPPNDPGDPNDPGSVWVDVWFGTDSNDLTGIDYTKVVDAGENTTTVQVYAPVIGETYYWQVDSYLDGSPTGDPNVGDVWVFYAADLPPSVDAGDDMITWSGEPVALDATIEDDGHSTLSYILWSAEPVDGTEVAFDPVTADVEDPIVTITKVPYSAAKIVNAGFEDPILADGDEGSWGDHPGWGWFGANTGAAVFNPGLPGTDYPAYGGNAPEGQNVVWVNGVSAIAQVLAETLAAETTYTLTVNVGVNSYYPTSTYKVELVAGGSIDAGTDEITGGTLLAEDDNSISLTPDVFATSTVTYDSTGVDAGLVGEALQIRLWCTKHINDDGEANFDNVQLTADPPFPPFTGVQTVTLTLSAGDAAGSREDTMEIDVYNNNCLAAKGAALASIDPADIDADCITNIEDFAEMALTWLVDYSLTEPAPKP